MSSEDLGVGTCTCVQEIPIVPDEGIIPLRPSQGETGSPIPVEVTDGFTEEVTAPEQSGPKPQPETLIEAMRPNVSHSCQLSRLFLPFPGLSRVLLMD